MKGQGEARELEREGFRQGRETGVPQGASGGDETMALHGPFDSVSHRSAN